MAKVSSTTAAGRPCARMFRDRLLAFTVEPDQVCINSQLCGAETHEFVGDLEWPLFRETIEQTHESDLTAKPRRLWERRHLVTDSKLNATESPKLFATEEKSPDIIVLLLE